MKKKQIKSLNSLDLENEVGKKFNSNKKIKTVWQNTIKDTGGYFSPLATLCLVVAIGVKNQILIDSKELEKILNNWKLEPVISSIEIIFLTSYKKYLDKAIEEYIDLSREQVQEKIHNNPLWKKAYEKGPDSVISFNDMNEKEKTTE